MLAGYAGILRTERNLDALVSAGRTFAPVLPALPGAWPLLDETARLFDLAGLSGEAAELAAAAWERGGPAALLVRAQRLRLAIGDLEGYAAVAARTVAAASLDPLAPTALQLAGRRAEAAAAAEGMLAVPGDPSLQLAAAWSLFAVAREAADAKGIAAAADRLARLFPGSPEAALALAVARVAPSRVVEAPTPTSFASLAAAVPPPAPQPSAPPTAPAPSARAVATWAVQAGSFKVRENADELARDLDRAGFTPLIREGQSQGSAVWRVYAGSGLDRAAADTLLARLRAAGYDGFAAVE